MNFFFVSPIQAISPGLYETFTKTFQEQGHRITPYISEADCLFFDMHSGYLPYDWDVLNYALSKQIPVIVFDAFDYHCDSRKHWHGFNNWEGLQSLLHQGWARFLNEARQNCKMIYFMRKMQDNADYGSFIYPYELCPFPDHYFPITTKEELFNRPYDICWIGASSPRRSSLLTNLFKYKTFHIDCQFTEERIPHEQWLNRHRQAKFYIESDGGGLGSERPYQLYTISAQLRQRNNQLLVTDWEDGEDCIKISIEPTEYEISLLLKVLNDPDKLYDIYLKGIEKMKTHFSEGTRANYILNILSRNGICQKYQ